MKRCGGAIWGWQDGTQHARAIPGTLLLSGKERLVPIECRQLFRRCYSVALWYEIRLALNFTALRAEGAARVLHAEELGVACSPTPCLTLRLNINL